MSSRYSRSAAIFRFWNPDTPPSSNPSMSARASPPHRSQSDSTRSIWISETAPESSSTERSTCRPIPIAASWQSASSALA